MAQVTFVFEDYDAANIVNLLGNMPNQNNLYPLFKNAQVQFETQMKALQPSEPANPANPADEGNTPT